MDSISEKAELKPKQLRWASRSTQPKIGTREKNPWEAKKASAVFATSPTEADRVLWVVKAV